MSDVRTGSTVVDFSIAEPVTSTVDNSIVAESNLQETYTELERLANKLKNEGSNMDTNGLGILVAVSTTISVVNTDGTVFHPSAEAGSPTNIPLIVGSVVGSVLLLSLIAIVCWCLRKKQKPDMTKLDLDIQPVNFNSSEIKGISDQTSQIEI